MKPLEELAPDELSDRFAAMVAAGRAILDNEGVAAPAMWFERYFVARYIGQMHDLQVPLVDEEPEDRAQLAARFHRRHREAYGVSVADEPVVVISARVRAIGRIPKPSFAGASSHVAAEPDGEARAWFEESGVVSVPLYTRAPWRTGDPIAGPAIVREYDSTTVVLPGQTWCADERGSLLLAEAV
jgi:N-methylhydantoinase A